MGFSTKTIGAPKIDIDIKRNLEHKLLGYLKESSGFKQLP